VTPLASDQWVLLLLVFLLGLFLGMYFLSGGRWKRRYREEVRRREALEAEYRERDSLRHAAERDAVRRDAAAEGTVRAHDERIVTDDTRPVARRRWWRP
jgi:hypothetical protein